MTAKRAVDFVLYISIGLALGLLCIAFAEYDIDSKWLGLLFETCLVFGFVIAQQRKSWTRPLFWIVLLVLFAIHVLAWILLLRQISNLRATWVGTAFFFEAVVCTVLLDVAVSRRTAVRNFRRQR